MPVYLRKYYLKRLETQFKDEKDEYEKAQKPAKRPSIRK
tara:strand:+ start:239 stop:355 length:117 start_codon:yes stop_codon:yes gene_type:complete